MRGEQGSLLFFQVARENDRIYIFWGDEIFGNAFIPCRRGRGGENWGDENFEPKLMPLGRRGGRKDEKVMPLEGPFGGPKKK